MRQLMGISKTEVFCHVKFTPSVIKSACEQLLINEGLVDPEVKYKTFHVEFENTSWKYDNESEFFADYVKNDMREFYFWKSFIINADEYDISISQSSRNRVKVSVAAPRREIVESVHQVFMDNVEKCTLPKDINQDAQKPTIFIGHGGSQQWRDLKDHLDDKHGYQINAYEVGVRAGHTVRDILEEMLNESSFALLVMTGEDTDVGGGMHARENVIHELGLFQGKIGFARAIILLENKTTEFSNIQGINQIRYSENNIKETFGEVLAKLKRELG